jgi:hypothetical protein
VLRLALRILKDRDLQEQENCRGHWKRQAVADQPERETEREQQRDAGAAQRVRDQQHRRTLHGTERSFAQRARPQHQAADDHQHAEDARHQSRRRVEADALLLQPVHVPGRDCDCGAERDPASRADEIGASGGPLFALPFRHGFGKPSFSGEIFAMPASLMIQESVITVGQTAS